MDVHTFIEQALFFFVRMSLKDLLPYKITSFIDPRSRGVPQEYISLEFARVSDHDVSDCLMPVFYRCKIKASVVKKISLDTLYEL
jgi:hypothetical protein